MKILRIANWILIFSLALLSLLPVTPVLADTSPPVIIETGIEGAVPGTGILYGIGSTNQKYTLYANGRHWVFYSLPNGIANIDIKCKSSETGEAGTWIDAGTVVTGILAAIPQEFSIWYDDFANAIHYVRYDRTNDSIVYRMGTPLSSGLISWELEDDVIADLVGGNLVTTRVYICVDDTQKPWVAWIDDDNVVTDRGIIYIRSSSTGTGVWTNDISDNITQALSTIWFASLTPLQAPFRVEIEYSMENIADAEMSLMASDDADDFTLQHVIAAKDTMSDARPDAFSFNNSGGNGVRAVWTNSLGDVFFNYRVGAENWTDAAGDLIEILSDGGAGTWLPTISTYSTVGGAINSVCIANNVSTIKYSILDGGMAWSWGAWTTIWNAPAGAAITRHVANYLGGVTTGLPVGFSWQVSMDDGLGTEYDRIYFWWFDTSLGYYSDTSTNGLDSFIFQMIPVFVALGFLLYALVRTRIAASEGNLGNVLIEVVVEGVAILVLIIIIANMIN
jgi:hypothetical protein